MIRKDWLNSILLGLTGAVAYNIFVMTGSQRLAAGTVTTIHDSDPLTRVRESSNGIHNLPVDDKAECHDCQWRY